MDAMYVVFIREPTTNLQLVQIYMDTSTKTVLLAAYEKREGPSKSEGVS